MGACPACCCDHSAPPLGGTQHPPPADARFCVLQKQVIQPINGDPFVGMLETPVTSAPIVANYLSNLPIYRVGVSPLLRGVEIGLAHGFLVTGPFIKVGAPLRVTCVASKHSTPSHSQHRTSWLQPCPVRYS